MIKVLPIYHKHQLPAGRVINTTSRSTDFGHELSPFFVGHCRLADGRISLNMENAWQYSKVYPCHVQDNMILPEWTTWSTQGFADTRAHRYPMGKGTLPLFALHGSDRLDYIESRKKIYIPLYANAVRRTKAYDNLIRLHLECDKAGEDLILLDFDAYDHHAFGMSYDDVINHQARKMGHAFVLAMALEEQLGAYL